MPVVVKKTILYLLNSYSLSLSIHHGYVAALFSSLGIYLVNMVTRVVMLTCQHQKRARCPWAISSQMKVCKAEWTNFLSNWNFLGGRAG